MAYVEERTRTSKRTGVTTTVYRVRYQGPDHKEHSRSFRRKLDATKFAKSVDTDIGRGAWVDPAAGRTSLSQFWERYDALNVHRRPTTVARDRNAMEVWWLPALGPRQLGSITPLEVGQVVKAMSDQRQPSTVRTTFGVFRAVMSAAVEAGMIGLSPCRGVKLPREEHNEIRFLSMAELTHLADTAPVDYRVAVWLAGALGLRWSEVAGLRTGRIDFLRRQLTVAETVQEVSGLGVFVDITKSKKSTRTLLVPSFVLEELSAHIARTGRRDPGVLLLTSPDGGMLRRSHFTRRVWLPTVRAAGLDGLTFHGLRHTAAGLLIQLGAHPKVIQQRMGHSSITVTLDVYGHVLPEVDDNLTARLDDLLRSGPNPAHEDRRGQ